MSNKSQNYSLSQKEQPSANTRHLPSTRTNKKSKDALMLNSYLYAAPNVMERFTQGERNTRTEHEARAAAAIGVFDRDFYGGE